MSASLIQDVKRKPSLNEDGFFVSLTRSTYARRRRIAGSGDAAPPGTAAKYPMTVFPSVTQVQPSSSHSPTAPNSRITSLLESEWRLATLSDRQHFKHSKLSSLSQKFSRLFVTVKPFRVRWAALAVAP